MATSIRYLKSLPHHLVAIGGVKPSSYYGGLAPTHKQRNVHSACSINITPASEPLRDIS